MKKFISIILVIFTLLSATALISCSSDNGYGVSKEIVAEIRAALNGKLAAHYFDDSDMASYYYFGTDAVEREVYWNYHYDDIWEEQSGTYSYYVYPDKIVTSIGDDFYYVFKNGEITYLNADEPYGGQ